MPDNQSQITNNQNSPPVLFIRADASSQIGTGHIMRCIALGQAWVDAVSREQRSEIRNQKSEIRDQGSAISQSSDLCPPTSVIFICAEIPDALADRIHSEGFELIRIDAKPGSPDDLRQTLSVISGLPLRCPAFAEPLPSAVRSQVSGLKSQVSSFIPLSGLSPQPSSLTSLWLVLDGYHFNLDYQRGIRAAGCKLLLIDDYNHLPEYECDILLNQNINATELDYSINPEARKLLGTLYALLRREFFRPPEKSSLVFSERENLNGSGRRILVTLGGADPDNVTLKVIKALSQLVIPDLQAKVIVGPANPHAGVLRQALSSSTINCELINSVQDMSGLMCWADLAVSAAGSTCWELCCLGVPFVTLILAENQRGLSVQLDRRGVAPCLGELPSVAAIVQFLKDLMENRADLSRRSATGRELVDGLGADRVLYRPAMAAGLDLLAGNLFLRPAVEADMDLFWIWANDPTVRANCYNPDSIALDNHKQWFFAKLASEDTLMLVLEVCGMPAGQIRYDRTGDVASIGFSIDLRFRGLGLGQRIIEESFTWAFEKLNVSTLRAEVFQSNVASQSAFVKTGFELAESCEIKGVPSVVFVKEK